MTISTGLQPKDRQLERVALNLMRDRLGMGGTAAMQTFDSFQPRPNLKRRQRKSLENAVRVARSFLDQPRTVVFHGRNGIGKTHLACAIGNVLLESYAFPSVPVYRIVFDDALVQLRRTYQAGYDGMGEEWYIDRWRSVPVLILEDVGVEGRDENYGPTDFTRRIGFAIVDGRYRAGHRPIVMTTNKSPAELADWITASAVSRLMEMGEFVEMDAEDWRSEAHL